MQLHPTYGLNPTLEICFYCGQETGAIALLGAAYKPEAPRYMMCGIEPCPACAEKFTGSTIIIEREKASNADNYGFTGRWLALPTTNIDEKYQQHKRLFMTPIDYNQLLARVGAV